MDKYGNMLPEKNGVSDKWLRAAAWVLGFLSIVLLLMSTVFRDSFSPVPAKQFNPVTVVRGTYVRLDIVGISGAVTGSGLSDGSSAFYSAKDSAGYYYMVKLKRSEFAKLSEQNEWWNSYGGSDKPEPHTIYGTARQLRRSERKRLAAALNITEQSYEDYFGRKYLDSSSGTLGLIDITLIATSCVMFLFSLMIIVGTTPLALPGGSEP